MRLCLNNQPLFQYGPLDQGYWPDGLYTAPSEEALRSDVAYVKALGCNMLRKHVKVEPARFYHECDRVGLIVWQDMPNGGRSVGALLSLLAILSGKLKRRDHGLRWRAGRGRAETREDYRRELREMVDYL
jgi:beta-galactosidase/beta-glucuronidase